MPTPADLALFSCVLLNSPAQEESRTGLAEAQQADPVLRWWASARLRAEAWMVPHRTGEPEHRHEFFHLRTRVGLEWTAHETLHTGIEIQDLRVAGLPDRAPRGPGAAYFAASGERSPEHLGVRQLFAHFEEDGLSLRVGRILIRDGMGPRYPGDPAFQRVRDRGDSRLVGIRDWPGGGRTFDGLRVAHESERLHLHAYAAEVNKSAFAVEETFNSLDHQVAGIDLFVPRGTLIAGTELRLFGVAFRDGRPVAEVALGDEVDVYTLGVQSASQYAVGPGQWDLFLWLAGQSGEFGSASQRSVGWVAETGYRLPDAPASPWLRIGHARAQGDRDPTDGRHEGFYNGVPTNHPRYGLLDLVAFSNLRDTYLELWLTPADRLSVQAALHHLAVDDVDDVVVSGGGAFDDDSFGYGALPTGGGRDLGVEVDLSAAIALPELSSSLAVGASYFFGSTVFERAFQHEDAAFGWLQWTLSF